MKSYKFLLIMLVASMLCFSAVVVSGIQMPMFSEQKLNLKDNMKKDNPLFFNSFEGMFKSVINHLINIIPTFIIIMINSVKYENLKINDNLDSDKDIKIDEPDEISEENDNKLIEDDNNEEKENEEPEKNMQDENNIEEEQDETNYDVDDEPDNPINSFDLEFTLDLEETYGFQEPIPVTAIIKNMGERTVYLCEMDVKFRSLDFEIETPEGYIIHYIGPFEGKGVAVGLAPLQTTSFKVNLTSPNVFFGETMNGPGGLFGSYNFPPGSYSIKGMYVSYQTLTAESASYFQGIMYSPSYSFTIK